MGIGKRIKQRREELGMTQEELAKRLGYKSKSTVNKVELGINDITQTKIKEYAKVLNTTPSYIMGWDESSNNFSSKKNNDEQSVPKILEYYNTLNPVGKTEAIERVKELTYIPKYSEPVLAAAHNDNAKNPEELDKIQKDLKKLKRPDN